MTVIQTSEEGDATKGCIRLGLALRNVGSACCSQLPAGEHRSFNRQLLYGACAH